MRVLVTRPEPDASLFAEEIRALGGDPVLQPLLQFQTLQVKPDAFQGAKAIALTSGNALRALEEMGRLEDVLSLPLFCVGTETARKARALGFQKIMAAARTAEDLGNEIGKKAGGLTPFIHVTGLHQAFDLARALENHGISTRTLSVYSMKARVAFEELVVRELRCGRIDSTVLMSARTAAIFVSLCQKSEIESYVRSLLYLCLSKGVAARLRPLEANNVRIAEYPTRQALLALLAAH